MKREARSTIEHEQRSAPELWERTMSRRHFIAAAGAGGGLLLVPGLAEKASASRQSTGVAACRFCAKSIVIEWNEAFLQGVRDSKLGPPMVARALAIGHTCIYEAWAAYDHRAVGTLLGSALRQPPAKRTLANKQRAMSFAAYRAAVDLFPVSKSSVFDPLMQTLGYDPGDLSTDTSIATGIGNLAAKAVLDVRHKDGANQLGDEPGGIPGMPYSDYTGYTPVNGPMDLRVPFDPTLVRDPNAWQPLRYVDANGNVVTPAFVGAQWQRVTPFALEVPVAAARFDRAGHLRLGRVPGPGSGPTRPELGPDRRTENDRRVLGGWPPLRASARALEPLRAVRLPTRQAWSQRARHRP